MTGPELNNDQQKIYRDLNEFVDRFGDEMFCIKGYAGTGKTYLISRWVEDYIDTHKNSVAMSAPTNKAVNVLKMMSGISNVDYKTIHSLLGLREKITNSGKIEFVPQGKPTIHKYNVLIIDEVSMLDDSLFHMIKIHASKIKIILMGDPAQIPPINKDDCIPFVSPNKHNITMSHLDKIMRQKEGNSIIDLSFHIRNKLEENALSIAGYNGNVDYYNLKSNLGEKKKLQAVFQDMYDSNEFKEDSDYCKVIAWTNKTVDKYNNYIRTLIYGDISEKIQLKERLIANSPIMKDEEAILISTNQEFEVIKLGVRKEKFSKIPIKFYECNVEYYDVDKNGITSKKIKILHPDSEDVFNEELESRRKNAIEEPNSQIRGHKWLIYYYWKRLFADVKYAYAITAHKSQGSTYNNVILILDDIMKNRKTVERNRILYTACTRAKEQLTIITNN